MHLVEERPPALRQGLLRGRHVGERLQSRAGVRVNREVMRFFFFLMIRRPPRSTLFPYTNALPISLNPAPYPSRRVSSPPGRCPLPAPRSSRSEEHTSELQSRLHLGGRLLLGKNTNTGLRSYRVQIVVNFSQVLYCTHIY